MLLVELMVCNSYLILIDETAYKTKTKLLAFASLLQIITQTCDAIDPPVVYHILITINHGLIHTCQHWLLLPGGILTLWKMYLNTWLPSGKIELIR